MPYLVLCIGFFASIFSSLKILPWLSWHGEWPLFAAVLGSALAAVRALPHEGNDLRLPSLVIVPCFVALIAIAQAVAMPQVFAGDAIVVSFYALGAATCLALGGNASKKEHLARVLASAMLLVAVISSFMALAQVLDVWWSLDWIARPSHVRRPGANLGQPNHLATLLVMGLASLQYLWMTEFQRWKSVTAVLGFVLLLGILVTESRTGLLSLWCLIAWNVAYRRHGGNWRSVMILVGIGALQIVGFAIWPHIFDAYYNPGAEPHVSATANIAVGARWQAWGSLWHAALDHPWMGWGLRNIAEAYIKYSDTTQSLELFAYSHNILLDVVVGAGWPVALVLIVCVLRGAGRISRNAGGTPVGQMMVGVCIPVAVHSMLEYPYAYAYFLFPLCLAMGVLASSANDILVIRLPTGLAKFAVVCGMLLGITLFWEYWQLEEDFRLVRFESAHVGSSSEVKAVSSPHLLTQLGAVVKVMRMPLICAPSDKEISELRKTRNRYLWLPLQRKLALALALSGKLEAAQLEFNAIRALWGAKAELEVREQWSAKRKQCGSAISVE
jgi:hypothetical protein